jgi:hypothetical protein
MRMCSLRPDPLPLVVLAAILVSGCASLGPRVQGETELVAWEATDLKLEQRDLGGRKLWYYSFQLLIRETRGTAITFTEIETIIYQPGTGSGQARYRGSWKLDAHDRFRIPLHSTLACHFSYDSCSGTNVPIPLWHIVMRGTDARGQALRTTIDISLPADPPATPEKTSKAVRAITLVPAKR